MKSMNSIPAASRLLLIAGLSLISGGFAVILLPKLFVVLVASLLIFLGSILLVLAFKVKEIKMASFQLRPRGYEPFY